MANTLSNLLSPMLSVPAGLADVHLYGATTRAAAPTVLVSADDDNGHIYPLVRLKASDVILQVRVMNTEITAGPDWDCGIYVAGDWNSEDQDAKDADILFDGQSMASARDTQTDLLGQGANALNAASYGKRLWELAGDAIEPRPGTRYDLCLTANTVGIVAGTIVVFFLYTSGD